uniref:Uncharacterized protein n=1 Tax=Arundo donax TaxID=35708 RepID=A0A0A9B5T2_ARUDO
MCRRQPAMRTRAAVAGDANLSGGAGAGTTKSSRCGAPQPHWPPTVLRRTICRYNLVLLIEVILFLYIMDTLNISVAKIVLLLLLFYL